MSIIVCKLLSKFSKLSEKIELLKYGFNDLPPHYTLDTTFHLNINII